MRISKLANKKCTLLLNFVNVDNLLFLFNTAKGSVAQQQIDTKVMG